MRNSYRGKELYIVAQPAAFSTIKVLISRRIDLDTSIWQRYIQALPALDVPVDPFASCGVWSTDMLSHIQAPVVPSWPRVCTNPSTQKADMEAHLSRMKVSVTRQLYRGRRCDRILSICLDYDEEACSPVWHTLPFKTWSLRFFTRDGLPMRSST